MIVVAKKDLTYAGGYVSDELGNVVNNPTLVHQYNELMEVKAFNKFLVDNEEKIKAVGTKVTYKPEPVALGISVPMPATPNKDEAEKAALDIFNEVEAVDAAKDANATLARYTDLVNFIADENVLITSEVTAEKFTGNPLELTAEDITDIIVEFHKLADLRVKVIVTQ